MEYVYSLTLMMHTCAQTGNKRQNPARAESHQEAEKIKSEAERKVKVRVKKLDSETSNLHMRLKPRLEEDNLESSKKRSLVEDVVETVLREMDKVTCLECRAIIGKREQDRENGSNAYFCANVGLVFYKRK